MVLQCILPKKIAGIIYINCVSSGMQKLLFSDFYRFSFLFALSMWAFTSFAQVQIKENDPVYGYDPLLYNGRIYFFYPVRGTEGTQYMFNTFDSLSAVTLKGKTYTGVSLNYDIFNQQLILKFITAVGSPNLMEVSSTWLEKASLGGRNFEVVTDANSNKRIYQVIGSGHERIMYYWSKELLIDNLKSNMSHYFSDGKKEMFVMIDNRFTAFRNTPGFIKSFPQRQQPLIKDYMRKHRINVKKATDFVITDLINYCNTL